MADQLINNLAGPGALHGVFPFAKLKTSKLYSKRAGNQSTVRRKNLTIHPDQTILLTKFFKFACEFGVAVPNGAETAAHANPLILNELIGLLLNEAVRHHAKRALVNANNGSDLGWQDLEWRA